MTTRETINADFKDAYKAKREVEFKTLRLIQAAIKQVEIDTQTDMNEDAVLKVVKSEVKKRKDSIAAYTDGGREDLADAEKAELAIIEKYLPAQMSEDMVQKAVEEVIAETGASSQKDFGTVMKAVMAKTGGAADGQIVSKLVKEKLS